MEAASSKASKIKGIYWTRPIWFLSVSWFLLGFKWEKGAVTESLFPLVVLTRVWALNFSYIKVFKRLKACIYRVTRRVFSEPVTSKLHLLNTKNLAGHLKTPKVIRISAIHANFSHSPVHSGPICFHRTKNLKLSSGTNKSK